MKLLQQGMVFCLLLLGGACSSDPESPSGETDLPLIEIYTSEIDFKPGAATSTTVKFKSNSDWRVSLSEVKSIPQWIDVSPKQGGAGEITLTVSVNETNPNVKSRSALIEIIAGKLAKSICVTQSGALPHISIDVTQKESPSSGERFEVAVTSNSDWTITNVPAWITLSSTNGTGNKSIQVSDLKNETGKKRSATLLFTSGEKTVTLTVVQNANQLEDLIPGAL